MGSRLSKRESLDGFFNQRFRRATLVCSQPREFALQLGAEVDFHAVSLELPSFAVKTGVTPRDYVEAVLR